MHRLDKPAEVFTAFSLAVLYSAASIFYFLVPDRVFYVKSLFGLGLVFAVPVAYFTLVALFLALYSYLLKQDIKLIAAPAIAIAVSLSLCYLFADMKVAMLKASPFGSDRRNIYNLYTLVYYAVFMGLFSTATGLVFRRIFKGRPARFLDFKDAGPQDAAFHLPMLAFFLFIQFALFSGGMKAGAVLFTALFIAALSSARFSVLLNRIKGLIARFLQNEKACLVAIFLAAFLIRYFWGMRLLNLSGDNFIRASDDGLTYDPFAATIAGGGLVPRDGAFSVSGFAYWYFLAAVYKIFGLHNFRAMIFFQALIGSSVPVSAYFIAKGVFRSKFVSALAGLMAAFNLTLIFLSVVIGMEALYIPLTAFALALTARILSKGRIDAKGAFLSGCAFGLANNARPELLLFPIALAAVFFIFTFGGGRKAGKAARTAFATLLGFAVFMSIQHITHYIKYGEFHLMSTAMGNAYTQSCVTDDNMILDRLGFNPFKDLCASTSAFANNPLVISKLLATGIFKRLIIFFFMPSFGIFDPVYLVNPSRGAFFRFPLYAQFYEYLFTAGGIIAAFLKRREGILAKTALFVFVIYIASLYAFMWVRNSRYRGVILPALIVFFSYGVCRFYEKVKERYKGAA